MRQKMELTETLCQQLIETAFLARRNAYTPYSHYKVGAALLCADGSIVTGCNIENAAFGPTICAERVAVFKAVSENKPGTAGRNLQAIVIVGGPETEDAAEEGQELSQYAFPCGVCRQVLREFVNPQEFTVITAKSIRNYHQMSLDELLPQSFEPDNLR